MTKYVEVEVADSYDPDHDVFTEHIINVGKPSAVSRDHLINLLTEIHFKPNDAEAKSGIHGTLVLLVTEAL